MYRSPSFTHLLLRREAKGHGYAHCVVAHFDATVHSVFVWDEHNERLTGPGAVTAAEYERITEAIQRQHLIA